MKVGYIQNSPIFGEKEKNFTQVESMVKNIEADLLVLPELFATGYTFVSKEEARDLAEKTKGETCSFLQNISQKTGAIVIGGFVEKGDSELYNSAIMVFKNKIIGSYRKIHLYKKETLWFSPGNRPFEVHDVNNAKIGMMICFDWIFPESLRSLALLGADIVAHSANLVLPFCQSAMKIRCLENHIFAITANRIGREKRGQDDFNFTGRSQITSIDGDVLSSAPINDISVDVIEVDMLEARNKSFNEYNNIFKDRKPDLYHLR
jgi:predicted amidohydrolase